MNKRSRETLKGEACLLPGPEEYRRRDKENIDVARSKAKNRKNTSKAIGSVNECRGTVRVLSKESAR